MPGEHKPHSVNWLSCGDFPDLPSCCDSCHDDWAGGWDEPVELEHEDSPLIPAGSVARVCCSKMIGLQEAAS